jgi:RNA polymerase sigma factor (sigma-70 family)
MAFGDEDGRGATPMETDDARERVAILYRDHASALRRRLRARLGSADEANDVLHDAFARLLGARPADGLRDPGAFLNRIVCNLLIDRSRRGTARPPHVPIEHDSVAVPAAQGQAIEVEQMRNRYREVIASLPPRMREVFVLHRVEGLSYKEIAGRLDISVRTVEWHIAEAIVRISRGLDRE